MKKASFYIGLIILLLCSCKKKTVIENTHQYPNKIVDLGLEKIFDIAKWELFKLNTTEDTIGLVHYFTDDFQGAYDTIIYSLSDLELDSVIVKSDTTILIFYPKYKGKGVYQVIPKGNYHTVIFDKDSLIRFRCCDEVEVIANEIMKGREADFIHYIQNNRNNLNNWLLNKSIEKEILKEKF
jgi:hypothetical protein